MEYEENEVKDVHMHFIDTHFLHVHLFFPFPRAIKIITK